MYKSPAHLITKVKSLTAETSWFDIDITDLNDELANALRDSPYIQGLRFTKGLGDYFLNRLHALLKDNTTITKIKIKNKNYPVNNPSEKIDSEINACLEENGVLSQQLNDMVDEPDAFVIKNSKLILLKDFKLRLSNIRKRCWSLLQQPTNHQRTQLESLLDSNTHVLELKICNQSISNKEKGLYAPLAFNSNLLALAEGRTTTLSVLRKLSDEQKRAATQLVAENRVTELLMQVNDWAFLIELPSQSALRSIVFSNSLSDSSELQQLMSHNVNITELSYCYDISNNHRSRLFEQGYEPSPTFFHLNTNKFISNLAANNLISLELKSALLTMAKLKIICERLGALSSLNVLKLTSIQCSEADAIDLILVTLLNNPLIKLRALELRDVALSDNAFQKLLSLLQSKPEFTRLSLSGINLDPSKITQLCQLLTRNIPLSHLTLSDTQLNNNGLNEICVALEANSKITSVNFSQNIFDMTGVASLTRLLMQNRFIRAVILESSCLKGADAKQFVADIKKTNCSLTTLSLSHISEKNNFPTTNDRGVRVLKTTPYLKKFQEPIDVFTGNNCKKRDELFNFVRRGEVSNTEKLLQQRVSPNCCDSEENTLLHVALQVKPINEKMVRLLVSQGAHTCLMNNQGQIPKDLLNPDSHGDILAILSADPASLVNKKPHNPQAASIARYFSPKVSGTPKRERSPSPPPAVVTLEQSSQPSMKVTKTEKSEDLDNLMQMAYVALMNDDVQFISQTINFDNANYQFPDGNFPLHIAANFQSQQCLRYLLQNGADATRPNALGQLPLHIACLTLSNEMGLEIIALLVIANTVNRSDQFGLTPLYCLAGGFNNQIDVLNTDILRAHAAKILLQHGAELSQYISDHQTREKMTVLHKSISRRCYRLTKVLLSHGTCNPSLQDSHGWSYLHHAVYQGDLTMVARLLIHPGIQLDQFDSRGLTPRQLARSLIFAPHVKEKEAIRDQINIMFEQRSKQTFPQLSSGIYWTKELTIRYGSRQQRNHDVVLSFEAEHARLQGVSRNTAGNYLTASLTFIVSKGKHTQDEKLPRTHITIKLTFADKFHVTNAWESREKIERSNGLSIFKKVERSPDALQRIIDRHNASPPDIREKASHNITETNVCLSVKGIQTLYYMPDNEVGDYDFEQRFHHSEQALFDHLQDPELLDQIVKALKENPDFQEGCKIYAVILNAFSKCYMCPDCVASTLGFQNTVQGEFFKTLKQKLALLQCALPKTGNLRSITLFSANFPTRHQYKMSASQHTAYDPIDLRTVNNNIILTQDAGEFKSRDTTYNSRK